jgi:hypothetical protein
MNVEEKGAHDVPGVTCLADAAGMGQRAFTL